MIFSLLWKDCLRNGMMTLKTRAIIIKAKKLNYRVLMMQLNELRQNLENRMMCGKCYLRTGHTRRNCTFESCNSARSCGDINKHPEEKAKCRSLLVKSILLKRIRKVLLMRSSLSEGPKRN